MNAAKHFWVRAGLVFLAVSSALLGLYICLFPRTFFSWAWVGMGMDYNAHLMLDYGAMTLASAIPLGTAAAVMSPPLIRSTLGAYAVWAVIHFLVHLHFRAHLTMHTSATSANLLLVILGVAALIPMILLGMTVAKVPGK